MITWMMWDALHAAEEFQELDLARGRERRFRLVEDEDPCRLLCSEVASKTSYEPLLAPRGCPDRFGRFASLVSRIATTLQNFA